MIPAVVITETSSSFVLFDDALIWIYEYGCRHGKGKVGIMLRVSKKLAVWESIQEMEILAYYLYLHRDKSTQKKLQSL